MKAVAKGISRHENGNLYFRGRVAGKMETVSLGTKNLEEARQFLLQEGLRGVMALRAARMALPSLPMGSSTTPPAAVALDRVTFAVSLTEALDDHDRRLILDSPSSVEMAKRGRRVVEKFTDGLQNFSPVEVWSRYRREGLTGKPVTSGANHLSWYLRSFVTYAVEKEWVPAAVGEEIKKIKTVPMPPRRIRVPSIEETGELLAMVATEDEEAAAYFRFLAASGLRLGGAMKLCWNRIDLRVGSMEVYQKSRGGTRWVVLPITPEALEILKARSVMGLERPWPFTEARVRRALRILKRFAMGLGMDLTYNHAFRHYFASHALAAGLTVQEVAALMGHQDGGQLVLRTYGHLISGQLRAKVASLRLIGASVPQNGLPDSSEGTAAA